MSRGSPVNIDDRFSRLVVIDNTTPAPLSGSLRVVVQCDCGTIKTVTKTSLRLGLTTSCGCYNKEAAKKRFTTHGMYDTSIYRTWGNMLSRCSNPKATHYGRYGGRGIKVTKRWHTFENFHADMGDKPEGHTIERINTDGNYNKRNCIWADIIAQANNRSNNRNLTHNGKTQSIAQWSRELGIKYQAIVDRKWKLGWSDEKTLTTPVRKQRG